MLIKTVKDLGAIVRSRRRDLGWDQRRLAEEVGVSRLWIIEFEKGKPRASTDLVLRTLRAVGLAINVDIAESVSNAGRADQSLHIPDIDLDAIINNARKKL